MRFSALLLLLLALPVFADSIADEKLTVDGRERRYLVHDFSVGQSTALVILLHGAGGSGDNMARQTGFDAVAAREDLIAVYPYGTNGLFDNVLLSWNAGHCCAYAMRENVDDVHFIAALIDHLIATRNVDPDRVYVTGLSNGGMMTHRLGRELPDKIAAMAPVISSNFGDEPLREFAMPTLIINGAADRIVRPEGGELGASLLFGAVTGQTTADRASQPIASQRDYWATVNGCKGFADTTTADYDLRTYSGCRSGGAVQSYVVNNNGHAWPGGTAPREEADQPVQTVNANELLWTFFKQYRRQPASSGTNTAYYYDELLTVPAFKAGGQTYSAQLSLLPRTPLEFSLRRLVPAAAATPITGDQFGDGLLTLAKVINGTLGYQAVLRQSGAAPVQLQLQMLTPVVK